MPTQLILSIDGGASSTRLAFIRLDNKEILKTYRTGPTYFYKNNKDSLVNLNKILKGNRLLNYTKGVVMGIAGVDTKKDLKEAKNIYQNYFNNLKKEITVDIVNDIDFSLSFCNKQKDLNIAIIAGTGSNCVGKYKHKKAKAGGLGHLLTDQGSGYYIGYNAIRKTVECLDYREEDTILAPLVMKKLGVKNLQELKDLTIKTIFEKREIASLTPIVVSAFAKGDKVSAKILENANLELIKHILAVDTHLDTNGNVGTSIVCTGSIFKIPYIKSSFNKGVQEYFNNVSILFPEKPPIFGGILYYINKYHS